MIVEHVRTTSAPQVPDAAPRAARTPTQAGAAARSQRPPAGPLCLLVPAIADGDSAMLIRTLRRRGAIRAVLLTRRAGRREVVALLGAGVRGAVTAEAQVRPRPTTPGTQPSTPAAPQSAPAEQADGSTPARIGPDLTAREIGVLRLVADGRSNRQIGEALDLSALTVKSHLARISRKIGTGDRAEMVAVAFRHALLS